MPQTVESKRWWVVSLAMVMPSVMTVLYFVLLPGTTVGRGLYLSMKILLVAWPLVATRLVLGEPLAFRTGEGGPSTLRVALVGLGIGIGIVAVMFLLMGTPLGEVVRQGATRIRTRLEGMGVLDHFLVFALFLSLAHSLIEEVYWRWFVFGNLHRLTRPWMACLASAFAFSAHHVVVLSQFFPLWMATFLSLNVGLGGAIWSLLLVRQRSLLGAWLSHMVVDLGIMAIGARVMGLL